MFDPEDFEIPLETKLRQRVIFDEIDECSNVEALRVNLKNVTQLFMRYQHMLNMLIAKQMQKSIDEFLLEAANHDKEIQS